MESEILRKASKKHHKKMTLQTQQKIAGAAMTLGFLILGLAYTPDFATYPVNMICYILGIGLMFGGIVYLIKAGRNR